MMKTILVGYGLGWALLASAPVHAEPGAGHHRKECKPDSIYSRWHYWAPGLVRWHQRNTSTFSGHATDHYPCVPNAISVIQFRCPAVPGEARYTFTGLPYDPAGPFMNPAALAPPVVAPEQIGPPMGR